MSCNSDCGIIAIELLTGAPGIPGGPQGPVGPQGPQGNAGTPGDRYAGTSATSMQATVGTHTFTVLPLGLAYTTAQPIVVASPTIGVMHGTVTTYNPATGVMVAAISDATGYGTGTDWTVNLAGAVGKQGDPGIAATIEVGTVTALDPGQTPTVVNVGTSTAATFNFGLVSGAKGDTGAQGPQGNPGNAASVNVGVVNTGAPGSSASVVNSGSTSAAIFNFTIPRGDVGAQGPKGDTGNAGASSTVSVGSTNTGAPGSSANVTNSGTSSAAVFNFTIPRGDIGATGAKGDTGTPGTPGAAASIAVGTVTNLPTGSTPTVTNSGTSSAAVFNFGLAQGQQGIQGVQGVQGTAGAKGDTGNPGAAGPKGDTGAQGPQGNAGTAATIAVGNVSSGDVVSVTNTGTSSDAVFDFVLQKGDKGDPGTVTILTGSSISQFTGDGTQASFYPIQGYTDTNVGSYSASIGGIDQLPTTNYTISASNGGTIIFSNAPANGVPIVVRAFVGASASDAHSLQGRAVATSAPTDGQALAWDAARSTWTPLSISGGNGNAIQLQGRDIASNTPADGQALTWNDGEQKWLPATLAPSSVGGQVWVSSTTYKQGDIVTTAQRDSMWICIANDNTGNDPTISPTWWQPAPADAVSLQLYKIATTAPTDGYALTWNDTAQQWEPQPATQGPQGNQGIQGIQGVQGIQGPKGNQGDQGPQGIPGQDGTTSYQGEYNQSTAYIKDNLVTYQNGLWVALQSTSGQTPESSPEYWTKIGILTASSSSDATSIQGTPVSDTGPSTGQGLVFNGSNYTPLALIPAPTTNNTALGLNANAGSSGESTVIGSGANNPTGQGIAIGVNALAGQYGISMGYGAGGTGGTNDGINIGANATSGTNGIAIGNGVSAGDNQVIIGGIDLNALVVSPAGTDTAFGNGATAAGGASVAIGASSNNSSGGGVAIGSGSLAGQYGVSIGYAAGGGSGGYSNNGISIGYHANAGHGGICIGTDITASADQILIGGVDLGSLNATVSTTYKDKINEIINFVNTLGANISTL